MNDSEVVEALLEPLQVCPVCGGKLGRVVLPNRIPEKYCPTMQHGVFVVDDNKLIYSHDGKR